MPEYGKLDTLPEAQTALDYVRSWLKTNAPGKVSPADIDLTLKEIDYWLHHAGEQGAPGIPGPPSTVTLSAGAKAILEMIGQELSLQEQSANNIMAGPAAGGPAEPTFRELVTEDLGTMMQPTFDEIRLTAKASSDGPDGTIFYCSEDKKVYVGVDE